MRQSLNEMGEHKCRLKQMGGRETGGPSPLVPERARHYISGINTWAAISTQVRLNPAPWVYNTACL